MSDPNPGFEPLTDAGYPRCQAPRKYNNPRNRARITALQGTQCTARALPGLAVCKKHGGYSPNARNVSTLARQEAALMTAVRRFGARRDIDPAAALLEVVHDTAGDVAWLRERITSLVGADPTSDEDVNALLWGVTREEASGDDVKTVSTLEPHPLWSMHEKAQDRLMRASAAAIAAGIAQQQVNLAQQQGLMVAGAVRGILSGMLAELQARGMPEELVAQWDGLASRVAPPALRALQTTAQDEE